MKTVFELLNHDNTISVNRRLAHALGLSEAVIYAALLAKHAWYEQHGKLSDGWFYSTVDDMEESTSLTKCQQSRCVKRLVSAGLIRCAAKGLPARRFFYIVDDPRLLEGIIGICEPSTEENAPAVRSETSPQEVRKSDGWQSGITAAGSAESSQKTKDNKTKENKIKVKFMEIETENVDEIKNLKQNIDKYTDYEVSFEYDDDGFINEVIIENV